jgi:hypothetical protein
VRDHRLDRPREGEAQDQGPEDFPGHVEGLNEGHDDGLGDQFHDTSGVLNCARAAEVSTPAETRSHGRRDGRAAAARRLAARGQSL